MKFSAAIVAAIAATSAVTDVSAFGVNPNLAVRSTFGRTALPMSLDDLQSKLLTDEPAPAAAKKSRGRKSKQAPAPAPAPVPEPVVVEEPKKKGRAKKEKYIDLEVAPKAKPVIGAKKERLTPRPAPKEKAAAAPKKEKPAPKKKQERPNRAKIVTPPRPTKAAVEKSAAAKDPNAGLGVALGAAPLVIAPFAALAAAKGALSKTVARREIIQEKIAEQAAAAAKKEAKADVDAGGVVGALVSKMAMLRLFCLWIVWRRGWK